MTTGCRNDNCAVVASLHEVSSHSNLCLERPLHCEKEDDGYHTSPLVCSYEKGLCKYLEHLERRNCCWILLDNSLRNFTDSLVSEAPDVFHVRVNDTILAPIMLTSSITTRESSLKNSLDSASFFSDKGR